VIFEKQRDHSKLYKRGGDNAKQIEEMLEAAKLADAVDEKKNQERICIIVFFYAKIDFIM
jgi:hypothetical protein